MLLQDLTDLQHELQRKDALIQKHYDKLQQLINRMSGGGGQVPQNSAGITSAMLGQQQSGAGIAATGPSQGRLAYLEQTSNIGQQSRPS